MLEWWWVLVGVVVEVVECGGDDRVRVVVGWIVVVGWGGCAVWLVVFYGGRWWVAVVVSGL